jgi:signal peptidase II
VDRRTAPAIVGGIAALVVVVDQLAKAWAVAELKARPPVEVLGEWLRLSFTTNSGAAFSIGTGNTWLFTLFAVALIVAGVYFSFSVRNVWWAISLGLIVGGGLGNLIDRIIREPGFGQGRVVDFIAVPHWPVFNVADMAVVGGGVLAAVLSLRDVDYKNRQGEPVAT